MKTINVKPVLALFMGIILFSCSKEKKERTTQFECEVSMQRIAGSYRFTGLTYKANSTAQAVDFMEFMDDCEKDDVVNFSPQGTYSYQDIGLVCSPNQSSTGTWRVDKEAIVSDGIVQGKITKFDCRTLVLSVTGIYTNSDQLEFILERQ